MCVIVVQPAGIELSGNKFRNCWSRNKDGGGYSFIQDEELIVKKGYFEPVKMLDEYREDVKVNPDSPFLLHFRISTSGVIDEVNSHPHRVRNDLVMAHNGHITGYGDKEQSDTLEFVALVLKRMPPAWEDDDVQTHLITRYINGDKMAFLRADGEYIILNEEAGNWQDGLWFSNKSWEKKKVYKSTFKSNYSPSKYKTGSAGSKSPANIPELFPADYTACGWDEDDLMSNQWGDSVYETYFDESCAYCDERLDVEDSEFCLQLDAWYPVCMDCIIEHEQELVQLGVVCDAVAEVWDEMDDKKHSVPLLVEVKDEKKEEEDKSPVTSGIMRFTTNVFSS